MKILQRTMLIDGYGYALMEEDELEEAESLVQEDEKEDEESEEESV